MVSTPVCSLIQASGYASGPSAATSHRPRRRLGSVTSLLRTVRALLDAFPRESKRFVIVIASTLAALSLFDIAALALLSLLLVPAITGNPLTLPVVGEIGQNQFQWLLLVVCLLIVGKDIAAVIIQRYSTRRFALFEQHLGAQLLDSFFFAPWTERLQRNSTDIVRSTDVGVASTVSGVLIPFTQLAGEVFTFVAVLGVLVVVRPLMAVIAIVYFALVGFLLYRYVLKRAVRAGQDNRKYSTKSVRTVSEMVHSLKEITLRGKTEEGEAVVLGIRKKASDARANQVFLGAMPRYVLEIALVGGFLIAAGIGYLQGGMTEALASLALFGVSGFRIVPSITRFQTIMGQTGANIPFAERVLEEIETGKKHRAAHVSSLDGVELAEKPSMVELRGVSFRYPGSEDYAVKDVSLTLPFGSSLALVGASGSGKSTLVDLMLGLLTPESGEIVVDGVPLDRCIRSWQRRIGYVPQQVSLFDSSVAHNVALTWSDDGIDEARVRQALRRAQLLDVIESRPEGIWGRVGEAGMNLSGGQRQRLGIARALYADPAILFMDEATSALDTATEALVTEAVKELAGEVTVVVVAHRLATIRHSDQVCFMEDAEIRAHGTFDEVVNSASSFAEQASLAGLIDRAVTDDSAELDFIAPLGSPRGGTERGTDAAASSDHAIRDPAVTTHEGTSEPAPARSDPEQPSDIAGPAGPAREETE